MLDTDFERSIYRSPKPAPADEGETLFTTFADRVVMRVDSLLAQWERERNPYPKPAALLKLLRPRVGIGSALLARDICERLQICPRELKQYVHFLRLAHRVQIGASRDGEAGGYYLISNEQESLESSQQMLHQAVAMLRVVRVLRSSHTVAELLGQVRLELEKGDADGR